MPTAIRITAGRVEVRGQLNDSETGRAIAKALPIEARGSTWGDEIYFAIPVSCGSEDPKEVVEMGDLAYWPPGSAFCIFFGPTPASEGDEIRPASAVNVIGRVEGDATVLKAVRSGETVRIEAAE
ncbi:MAG TPA: cyclophilin-like fold protein [Armatimonadota bacterium]|nr:cyclophilin-like fold protein [Armatimonadota bacterium]